MEKPHAFIRRALVATSLAALVTSTCVTSATADDDLKHRQKQVQAGIKGATADLEESSHAALAAHQLLVDARAQLASARTKLAGTQASLAQAQAVAAQVQAALVQAQAALDAATAQVEQGRARVVDQRLAVGRMAAQSVQGIDPRVVGLVALVSDDDPANLSDQIQGVGNVLDRQTTALAQLRTAEQQLRATRRQVAKAEKAVAQRKAEAEANVADQQRYTEQAAADQRSVAALVTDRHRAQKNAEAAETADKAQLAQLKAENDRITKLLAAQAAKAHSYANDGPLLRPVDGEVTSPFGYRVHPIYGYYSLHDGTDFHAPCGTPLRAAGNGKVIQEYYQSAWGNRLILDLGKVNGHGVSVIYNHLSAYKASTGDTVTRGDTVGYAGTTGWSTGCHLHFTVMVDGKPQDPMNWF